MEQLQNAIRIVKHAIDNKKSIQSSCLELGFHKKYVKNFNYNHKEKLNPQDKKLYTSILEEYYSIKTTKGFNQKTNDVVYDILSTHDSNIDEKFDERSKGWEERDENGKILKYKYLILIRDESPLSGELTLDQMETIYQNYPHVNVYNCSQYFPYLTFQNFKRIIRTFNITKDQLFPKHIVESHTPDELAEFALKAKIHAGNKKVVENKTAFLEKSLREYQQKLAEISKDKEFYESVVDKYYNSNKNSLSDYKPRTKDLKSPKTAYCLFSDIHYGKNYNRTILGRAYNKDIAHDRIMQIAKKTVEYIKENRLNHLSMSFFGDLLENALEDGMHPGHHKEIDLFSDDQIFYAIESISECLKYILDNCKVEKFDLYLIGGNHDRLGEQRGQDINRTGSRIAFRIIQRDFKNIINVVIPDDNMIRFTSENLCFIGHHGDSMLHKKKPYELVNFLGEGTSKYHIVAHGHWHKTTVEYGTNYTYISLPSVCSADKYVIEQLGCNTLAGFILGMQADFGFGFDYKMINLY